MGKNLVVIGFLLTCGFAAWVFFERDDRLLREHMDPDTSGLPRLVLEDFTLYRYENHKVTSTLSARLGQYLEPNLLEMYGDIRGLRHNTERRDLVTSQSALVFFRSRGIRALLENAKIEKVELEDSVMVSSGQNILETEYAEFLPDDNLLRSDLEVRVRGPRGRFTGGNGFVYHTDTEDLLIEGPLKGTLQKGLGGGRKK